jgi:hypothetical protein
MKGTVMMVLIKAEPLKDFLYRTYAPGIPMTRQITVETNACQTVNQSTGQTLASL